MRRHLAINLVFDIALMSFSAWAITHGATEALQQFFAHALDGLKGQPTWAVPFEHERQVSIMANGKLWLSLGGVGAVAFALRVLCCDHLNWLFVGITTAAGWLIAVIRRERSEYVEIVRVHVVYTTDGETFGVLFLILFLLSLSSGVSSGIMIH